MGGEEKEPASIAALTKLGSDFPLCSYCEDGFMHCTTSGAPGSLLPDTFLSSPLSHRSEYCPPGRALHVAAGLLCLMCLWIQAHARVDTIFMFM